MGRRKEPKKITIQSLQSKTRKCLKGQTVSKQTVVDSLVVSPGESDESFILRLKKKINVQGGISLYRSSKGKRYMPLKDVWKNSGKGSVYAVHDQLKKSVTSAPSSDEDDDVLSDLSIQDPLDVKPSTYITTISEKQMSKETSFSSEDAYSSLIHMTLRLSEQVQSEKQDEEMISYITDVLSESIPQKNMFEKEKTDLTIDLATDTLGLFMKRTMHMLTGEEFHIKLCDCYGKFREKLISMGPPENGQPNAAHDKRLRPVDPVADFPTLQGDRPPPVPDEFSGYNTRNRRLSSPEPLPMDGFDTDDLSTNLHS